MSVQDFFAGHNSTMSIDACPCDADVLARAIM